MARQNPANGWLRGFQAAQRAGMRHTTWKSYVNREVAPPPDGHDDNGRRRWRPETIDAWRDNRPGRGYRSDLHGKVWEE